MDLQWLAILVMVVSLPGCLWDLATSRTSPQRESVQSWLQLAWLGLLVGALGLCVVQNWLDFSTALLVATVITGLVLLAEHLWYRKTVSPDAAAGVPAALEPAWLDLGRSFFWVIFAVFFVRSFVVEPFKIPSGSMIPTLRVGDFILVNKFAYGLRLPVTNQTVITVGSPQRGDVMVFHYPRDPNVNYVKRVIGLPGDVVTYTQKQLSINGKPVSESSAPPMSAADLTEFPSVERLTEQLGTHQHFIHLRPERPTLDLSGVMDFPNRDACSYNSEGFTCTVPSGSYFMMGDNRDSSSDSRYWGFVPDKLIVGRAFVVWWSFEDFSRLGRIIP